MEDDNRTQVLTLIDRLNMRCKLDMLQAAIENDKTYTIKRIKNINISFLLTNHYAVARFLHYFKYKRSFWECGASQLKG